MRFHTHAHTHTLIHTRIHPLCLEEALYCCSPLLAVRFKCVRVTKPGVQWYDANVSLPGCDKNMPGALIAMARHNRPSIMVYGGTIRPGHSRLNGETLDIVSAFQSYGRAFSAIYHVALASYGTFAALACLKCIKMYSGLTSVSSEYTCIHTFRLFIVAESRVK